MPPPCAGCSTCLLNKLLRNFKQFQLQHKNSLAASRAAPFLLQWLRNISRVATGGSMPHAFLNYYESLSFSVCVCVCVLTPPDSTLARLLCLPCAAAKLLKLRNPLAFCNVFFEAQPAAACLSVCGLLKGWFSCPPALSTSFSLCLSADTLLPNCLRACAASPLLSLHICVD